VIDRPDLSFNQELVWGNEHAIGVPIPFIECPRHVSVVNRIAGDLDLSALAANLNQLIARHTALHRIDGSGSRDQRVSIVTHTEAVSDDAALAWIRGEVDRCFELSADLPLRVSCAQLADRVHLLAITIHHIVCDGWSKQLLIKDLSALSHSSPLSEVRYSDSSSYSLAQRSASAAGDWDAHRSFWLREFDGWLRRDADARSTPGEQRLPEMVQFTIVEETAGRLRSLARSNGVTMATLMAGVFAGTVHCLAGMDAVCLGVPIVDRPSREWEQTVGLLMNVLPVRVSFDRNPTGRELIADIRHAFEASYGHRQIPYELLIRALGCRDGRAPVPFRIVFNYINVPQPRLRLPDCHCEPVQLIATAPAAADVSLHVNDNRAGLRCTVIASAPQWRDRARRLEPMFRAVTAALLDAIDAKVGLQVSAAH
jgi:Condensation domain